MPKSGDRVSYSFGMKLTTRQYESADFHINLTSDVKDGETWEQAFERVKEFVEDKAGEQHDGIRKAYAKA